MQEDGSANDRLTRLQAIVGTANVLTGAEATAPYLTEWRDYYHGRALAVVRPGSAAEIAAILRLAGEMNIPVVPQGGNTGLVGGQVPDASGRELVLSLERLDRIRSLDAEGATLTCEAGVVLDRLHEAAAAAGMLFPLSLSSQGSCRIGGNIATNAGGVQVLSYGNTRSLVLGLEVVLASGEIWNGLRALPKDNSGYDLKQLFIGSEGTLGIITAAVLRLFPAPRGQAVAFAAVPSPHEALVLLKQARAEAGAGLTAFELIPRIALEMVVAKLPGAQDPFAAPSPWYVLMEVSSGRDEADAGDLIVRALTPGLEAGTVTDAVVANSVKEAQAFWRIRHALSEVQKHFGASIKHDVSVPVQRVPDFLDRAIAAVKEMVPGIRPVPFGHLGDGNIHFNLTQPEGADGKAYFARAPEVHRLVHGIVTEMGGSIAAEHGVGLYKRELLKEVKSPVELAMMRKLKATFDPNGILNPGKVV